MPNWKHEDARAAYISMRIREEEARLKESKDARRLSRYDEAVRLLRVAKRSCGEMTFKKIEAFLAEEPKGVGA